VVVTLTVTASVSVVVVPEAGFKVNQGALSLTDQFRVPTPVLVMLRVCVAGFAPPWTPVKLKLVGLRPMVGEEGGGGVGGKRMACTSGRWVSLRGGLTEPVPG